MPISAHSSGALLTRRTFWVSLILVLSLLYNPFLAASVSCPGTSVSHPASYRATVASSELLKFGTTECADHLVVAGEVQTCVVILVLPQTPPAAPTKTDVAAPADPLLSNHLWSRPPPAVRSL